MIEAEPEDGFQAELADVYDMIQAVLDADAGSEA